MRLIASVLRAVTRALLALTVVAGALALLFPSGSVARRSDLLLAALVLATALGIPGSQLLALRRRAGTVLALSIAPLVVLSAFAWGLGHAFAPATRDGLLAVGLSSSEVASVGLAALAGADATIALGAVAGSLVIAAVAGPAAIGWLAGGGAGGGAGHLLVRFALVVLVPLAVGVAVRSAPATAAVLRSHDGEREGIAALAVVALVYAALSGTHGAHGLGPALVASVCFAAGSALLAWAWHAWARPPRARPTRARPTQARQEPAAVPGALAIGMRDFAVAAALAAQAFGPRAGAVPGVYGVVVLLGGSAFVTIVRHRRRTLATPRE